MSDYLQYRSKLPPFAALLFIGLAAYLIAWGTFHAYTTQTVLFPIMIADLLSKLSGRSSGDGSGLGYLAILVAAILAGLLFATVYWPIEHWIIRTKLPSRVRAARIIAGFLFFLLVWLAFPLSEAL